MQDKIEGYLEIGTNERDEIVINLPEDKTGHIIFSIAQAYALADSLVKQARIASDRRISRLENKARIHQRLRPHFEGFDIQRDKAVNSIVEAAEESLATAVDFNARVLADGSPVTDDHREIQADGMQKGYVVLTAVERAKGFVRPVRQTYTHKNCGVDTTMGLAIAETYARAPGFYDGTFCARCREHRPLTEFVWKGTQEQVGS